MVHASSSQHQIAAAKIYHEDDKPHDKLNRFHYLAKVVSLSAAQNSFPNLTWGLNHKINLTDSTTGRRSFPFGRNANDIINIYHAA